MNRSIENGTAASIRQVLLLFHDLARTLRYQRFLLQLILYTTIFKPLIHLSLPAAIIVRKWNIEVSDVTTGSLFLAPRKLLL